MIDNCNVYLMHKDVFKYPKNSPFRPSIAFPEYRLKELSNDGDYNAVYDLVRDSFILMGLDKDNYGTSNWNPLGCFVSPGNTVLIKPNLVHQGIRKNDSCADNRFALYTQPSVVAAVMDYVLIALDGIGKIIIGDAPVQECDFDKLMSESGYLNLVDWYKSQDLKNVNIEIKDLRKVRAVVEHGVHHHVESGIQETIVDIGDESEFAGFNAEFYRKLRIENFDPDLLYSHNNEDKHEYFFAKDVLDCDVFINMPKPKTHRKAGVTASLKNIIGTISRKECIAHHAEGSSVNHGDQYLNPSFLKSIDNKICDWKVHLSQGKQAYTASRILGIFDRVDRKLQRTFTPNSFAGGSWYGNDTISKSIIDVNRILFYADKNGRMCDTVQRKYLVVADMIVSGERNGPMRVISKDVGMIAIGTNPVAFDEIIAKLIGIKLDRFPTLYRAKKPSRYKLCYDEKEPIVISNDARYDKKGLSEIRKDDILYFIPPDGWIEAFEKKDDFTETLT